MVFKLARAVVGLEVATEVLFVATTEEFLFYLVDVGQVVGPAGGLVFVGFLYQVIPRA